MALWQEAADEVWLEESLNCFVGLSGSSMSSITGGSLTLVELLLRLIAGAGLECLLTLESATSNVTTEPCGGCCDGFCGCDGGGRVV